MTAVEQVLPVELIEPEQWKDIHQGTLFYLRIGSLNSDKQIRLKIPDEFQSDWLLADDLPSHSAVEPFSILLRSHGDVVLPELIIEEKLPSGDWIAVGKTTRQAWKAAEITANVSPPPLIGPLRTPPPFVLNWLFLAVLGSILVTAFVYGIRWFLHWNRKKREHKPVVLEPRMELFKTLSAFEGNLRDSIPPSSEQAYELTDSLKLYLENRWDIPVRPKTLREWGSWLEYEFPTKRDLFLRTRPALENLDSFKYAKTLPDRAAQIRDLQLIREFIGGIES